MDAGTIIQVIRWHKVPPCALVHSVHNRFGDRWMYRENRSPASVPLTQTLLRIATPSKRGRAWSNDPGTWILVHAGINGWRGPESRCPGRSTGPCRASTAWRSGARSGSTGRWRGSGFHDTSIDPQSGYAHCEPTHNCLLYTSDAADE